MNFEQTLTNLITVLNESGISAAACHGCAEALTVITKAKMIHEMVEGGEKELKKRGKK